MTSELSRFMHDLPQRIYNINDAKRLRMKWEGDAPTFLWKGTINSAIPFIEPDEQIYLFTWAADWGSTISNTGVVFFSQKRIAHYDAHNNLIVIPLSHIRTVAASEGLFFGKIEFCTEDASYELRFTSKKNVPLMRELLIHLAAGASCPGKDGVILPVEEMSSLIVEECPGCSAAVILHDGIGKCEYCDRHVGQEKKDILPPAPVPVAPQIAAASSSIADELKKYKELLDMGAINVDEYNAAKARLLGQL